MLPRSASPPWLGRKELAAAVRAGQLVQVAPGIVLTAGAVRTAAARLADLAGPFSVAQVRGLWGSSRRVTVPLLEHLDRSRVTSRGPDDRRVLRQEC